MKTYCRSILDEGGHRFLCPHVGTGGRSDCNLEWEYSLVRHVSLLSLDERKYFESRISENYARRTDGIQKCPGRQVFCMRQDMTDQSFAVPCAPKRREELLTFAGCACTRCIPWSAKIQNVRDRTPGFAIWKRANGKKSIRFPAQLCVHVPDVEFLSSMRRIANIWPAKNANTGSASSASNRQKMEGLLAGLSTPLFL